MFNLNHLLELKKESLAERKAMVSLNELERRLKTLSKPLSFKSAVSKPTSGGAKQINIIAEIKRSSPSNGVIRQNFDVSEIAKSYSDGGASAVSVLTEKNYFAGDVSHMEKAGWSSGLPVLRKDFITDPYEICEARGYAASAILLIVRMLEHGLLKELMSAAREYGLDALVEAHNEKELDIALACGAVIIGINTRDLATLTIDKSAVTRIAPLVPPGCVTVAESGISGPDDIKPLKTQNVHAALIGNWLLRQQNITEALRSLVEAGR